MQNETSKDATGRFKKLPLEFAGEMYEVLCVGSTDPTPIQTEMAMDNLKNKVLPKMIEEQLGSSPEFYMPDRDAAILATSDWLRYLKDDVEALKLILERLSIILIMHYQMDMADFLSACAGVYNEIERKRKIER